MPGSPKKRNCRFLYLEVARTWHEFEETKRIAPIAELILVIVIAIKVGQIELTRIQGFVAVSSKSSGLVSV